MPTDDKKNERNDDIGLKDVLGEDSTAAENKTEEFKKKAQASIDLVNSTSAEAKQWLEESKSERSLETTKSGENLQREQLDDEIERDVKSTPVTAEDSPSWKGEMPNSSEILGKAANVTKDIAREDLRQRTTDAVWNNQTRMTTSVKPENLSSTNGEARSKQDEETRDQGVLNKATETVFDVAREDLREKTSDAAWETQTGLTTDASRPNSFGLGSPISGVDTGLPKAETDPGSMEEPLPKPINFASESPFLDEEIETEERSADYLGSGSRSKTGSDVSNDTAPEPVLHDTRHSSSTVKLNAQPQDVTSPTSQALGAVPPNKYISATQPESKQPSTSFATAQEASHDLTSPTSQALGSAIASESSPYPEKDSKSSPINHGDREVSELSQVTRDAVKQPLDTGRLKEQLSNAKDGLSDNLQLGANTVARAAAVVLKQSVDEVEKAGGSLVDGVKHTMESASGAYDENDSPSVVIEQHAGESGLFEPEKLPESAISRAKAKLGNVAESIAAAGQVAQQASTLLVRETLDGFPSPSFKGQSPSQKVTENDQSRLDPHLGTSKSAMDVFTGMAQDKAINALENARPTVETVVKSTGEAREAIADAINEGLDSVAPKHIVEGVVDTVHGVQEAIHLAKEAIISEAHHLKSSMSSTALESRPLGEGVKNGSNVGGQVVDAVDRFGNAAQDSLTEASLGGAAVIGKVTEKVTELSPRKVWNDAKETVSNRVVQPSKDAISSAADHARLLDDSGLGGAIDLIKAKAGNDVKAARDTVAVEASSVARGVKTIGGTVFGEAANVSHGVKNVGEKVIGGTDRIVQTVRAAGEVVVEGAAITGHSLQTAGETVADGAASTVHGVKALGSTTLDTVQTGLEVTKNLAEGVQAGKEKVVRTGEQMLNGAHAVTKTMAKSTNQALAAVAPVPVDNNQELQDPAEELAKVDQEMARTKIDPVAGENLSTSSTTYSSSNTPADVRSSLTGVGKKAFDEFAMTEPRKARIPGVEFASAVAEVHDHITGSTNSPTSNSKSVMESIKDRVRTTLGIVMEQLPTTFAQELEEQEAAERNSEQSDDAKAKGLSRLDRQFKSSSPPPPHQQQQHGVSSSAVGSIQQLQQNQSVISSSLASSLYVGGDPHMEESEIGVPDVPHAWKRSSATDSPAGAPSGTWPDCGANSRGSTEKLYSWPESSEPSNSTSNKGSDFERPGFQTEGLGLKLKTQDETRNEEGSDEIQPSLWASFKKRTMNILGLKSAGDGADEEAADIEDSLEPQGNEIGGLSKELILGNKDALAPGKGSKTGKEMKEIFDHKREVQSQQMKYRSTPDVEIDGLLPQGNEVGGIHKGVLDDVGRDKGVDPDHRRKVSVWARMFGTKRSKL